MIRNGPVHRRRKPKIQNTDSFSDNINGRQNLGYSMKGHIRRLLIGKNLLYADMTGLLGFENFRQNEHLKMYVDENSARTLCLAQPKNLFKLIHFSRTSYIFLSLRIRGYNLSLSRVEVLGTDMFRKCGVLVEFGCWILPRKSVKEGYREAMYSVKRGSTTFPEEMHELSDARGFKRQKL
ncbi:hypothetical protein C5167_016384 [Papaver somniferum]|nr:hypothetical protein C5167_016384 [Papaver somniferum]